jgi:hypothetical protein
MSPTVSLWPVRMICSNDEQIMLTEMFSFRIRSAFHVDHDGS